MDKKYDSTRYEGAHLDKEFEEVHPTQLHRTFGMQSFREEAFFATVFKMRSDDEEWKVLMGRISQPFKRGAKTLRVFYPDDLAEAPFFVAAEEGDIRRGVMWREGDEEDLDIYFIASEFLQKVTSERDRALKYMETFDAQIEFLKNQMAVSS